VAASVARRQVTTVIVRRAPESQVRHDPLRAAILVSGGLAPGINATIEGIVERHEQYTAAFREGGQHYTIELGGYQEGFKALIGTAVHTHLKKIAEDLRPKRSCRSCRRTSMSGCCSSGWGRSSDSPVEETGFKPSVPLA